MYKLTVINKDRRKRVLMALPSDRRAFLSPRIFPDVEPAIFDSYESVIADREALKAIACEALDHGDAAQLEPIEAEE